MAKLKITVEGKKQNDVEASIMKMLNDLRKFGYKIISIGKSRRRIIGIGWIKEAEFFIDDKKIGTR